MKPLTLALASGLLLLSSQPSAATTAFQFSGEVKKDSYTSTSYGLSLEPGQLAILDMPDNLKLELSTPGHGGNGTVTVVRLLRQRADSSKFDVLHEAQTTAPSSNERSITYLVCGDKVTFQTPAPTTTPKCAH